MAVTIELGYFNTFALKRLASTAVPQVADPNEDWFIEESRIKGGYNNKTVDFGVKAYLVEDISQSSRRTNSLIYSGVFNSRTGVNQTNQFSVAEEITRSVDPINGSIQKLYAEDTNLIVFQEKKVNRALIDKDAIYSAEGSAITTTANLVIGQITPYAGNWGIGTNPESFAVYGYRKYFVDKNRNAVLRLSQDGITELSNYGMSDYFRDQLSLITSTGKITGGWDIHNKNYILNMVPSYGSLSYQTLCFDERSLGWTTFYTYNPSFITSVKGNLYTSKDGKWYQSYVNGQPRNKFHDDSTSSQSTVKFILNPAPDKMKNFNTLSYEGTNGWEVTSIISDETGYDLNANESAYVSETDVSSTIWSYDQGQYQEGGVTQYAGFARKQNNYVAAIKSATPAQVGEVIFGNSMMGIKGYTAVVTMTTDTTRSVTANGQTINLTATNDGGLKELFSVGSTFSLQ